MDFFVALILFVLLSAIVTYIIKVKTKFDTYFLISLIKTKRPIAWLEAIAKKAKFLDILADFFIFLGFGAMGVDFVHGREKNISKRATIFLFSSLALSLFFFLLDLFFGGVFSMSPLTKGFFPLIVFVFAVSGFSGFILLSLAIQGIDIISKILVGKTACPGIAPMIPGVKLPNVPIVIPLHAWLSLFIILIVHEGMHGVVAIIHKFRIKSTGVVLFGFLPIAAFVEPDEKELEKAENKRPKEMLRFLAAGSGGNLLSMPAIYALMFVFILIISVLFSPWQAEIKAQHPETVYVTSVDQNSEFCGDVYPSPSYGIIDKNWAILSVNGKAVNNQGILESELGLNRFKEAKFKFLKTDGNIFGITLKPNELGSFGFSVYSKTKDGTKFPENYKFAASIISLIFDFMNWLFLLSFLMAIANFLPMTPFDGGRMARIIFAPYFPLGKSIDEKKDNVGRFFFFLTLAIFAVNVVPLFM